MASTHEQRAAYRKIIYFVVILLLFTGSLLHRKFINAQADDLILRDVGRGKADLTSSTVRLTLSGARGVAVTSLWLAAQERQKKHEWNELEVIVDSLTHLQPRFVSPWLYQGWNLAFNVSVECDRVRDKYYYITRGITLLCRGEEKNDPGQAVPPRPWPADPQMRFEIGHTYQFKIGQSDENKTLRCLFDMSCIPLSERNPDQFYTQGKQIDFEKFKTFCENHPRLVRRLRERLVGFEQPQAIIGFLTDNKDIPGRVEDRRQADRLAEFPILPPQDSKSPHAYPDWRTASLATANEDFDTFICGRAWFTYAQIPLPEPGKEKDYDRLKHRLPRPTTVIFRAYPAHGQANFAEELQKDGWFDDSGWDIRGKLGNSASGPAILVGASGRYNSGDAWSKAHDLYRYYGLRNDLYFEPAELKKLQQELRRGSKTALEILAKYDYYRGLTNFSDHFQKTQVEQTQEAVAARKAIFEVEHTAAADPNAINIYRDTVLPQWLDLLLRHPEFHKIETIQSESYELQAKYFKLLQFYNKGLPEKVVIGAAYAAPVFPMPGALVPLGDPNIARTIVYWNGTGELPGAMPPLSDPDGKFSAAWPKGVLTEGGGRKGAKVLYLREVEGLFDQLYVMDNL
ncbi:MAG TPA: hypothetical protein VE988_29155, partial [Gemmataceae bacterium]|nr:hypothetical protein [Gemmataceae bacterium]